MGYCHRTDHIFLGGLLWHLNFGLQKLRAESSELSGLFYARLEENIESSADNGGLVYKVSERSKGSTGAIYVIILN